MHASLDGMLARDAGDQSRVSHLARIDRNVGRQSSAMAVAQVVEHNNFFLPRAQQFQGDAADVAGSAGDEKGH